MASTPPSSSSRAAVARNSLLEVMPPEVLTGLMPLLELVPLKLGEVLYESGVVQQYVYFPTDSSSRCCTCWKTGNRPKSPSSDSRAWSAFRC